MRITCAAILVTTLLANGSVDQAPVWHDSVDAAFAEARRAHKPILAVLHCPH